jgi:colanic acid/amylovoran biosynthesis glycosyltransferase
MLSGRQIRIAYLISQYPAFNHTFILREIRQLRQMGFDIHVVSISGADRPFEHLTSEEQEEQRATFYVKPAGVASTLAAHLRMLFIRPLSYALGLLYSLRLSAWNMRAGVTNLLYFAEAVVFADWMRRQGLSHFHMHFTSTVGLIVRHAWPVRASVTIHGPDEFSDPAGFYMREKIETFDLLCTISQFGRSQLMLQSGYSQYDKFRVSRLGVDPHVYTPRPFSGNPSRFEIISVGRLAPAKGFHVLVAALDRLLREGRSVRLRLVGDGPGRAGLEQHVAKLGLGQHIIFEGRQNADRVLHLYQEADIFALPSFAEGIPVVLMEAMAMEIPCVTTWITGIPELIRNEVDGLLIPPSSEEDLAAALGRLMDDSALRLRLGKSGRQRVLERFDLKRNTELLANILCDFVT